MTAETTTPTATPVNIAVALIFLDVILFVPPAAVMTAVAAMTAETTTPTATPVNITIALILFDSFIILFVLAGYSNQYSIVNLVHIFFIHIDLFVVLDIHFVTAYRSNSTHPRCPSSRHHHRPRPVFRPARIGSRRLQRHDQDRCQQQKLQ